MGGMETAKAHAIRWTRGKGAKDHVVRGKAIRTDSCMEMSLNGQWIARRGTLTLLRHEDIYFAVRRITVGGCAQAFTGLDVHG
jgi:hypothetical protein